MGNAKPDAAGSRLMDWPVAHGYVGKATPRAGNGWQIKVYAHDPEAPNQARLVGIAESPTLERVEERTWELVHALDDSPDVRVAAGPEIEDAVMTRVIESWAAMKRAKEAEAEAAAQIRRVVRELRERGLSITDIAFLTHVSRGRISQLLV